jgi:hypothetical protein
VAWGARHSTQGADGGEPQMICVVMRGSTNSAAELECQLYLDHSGTKQPGPELIERAPQITITNITLVAEQGSKDLERRNRLSAERTTLYTTLPSAPPPSAWPSTTASAPRRSCHAVGAPAYTHNGVFKPVPGSKSCQRPLPYGTSTSSCAISRPSTTIPAGSRLPGSGHQRRLSRGLPR